MSILQNYIKIKNNISNLTSKTKLIVVCKNQNIDKCYGNSESIKNCAVKMLKSPSNIALFILTYVIWSMLGMSYSSNQNFDMTVTPQYYVMLLSFISILAALINYNTKMNDLRAQ
jgi:hypothetical protein